jgi:hypothetical protein
VLLYPSSKPLEAISFLRFSDIFRKGFLDFISPAIVSRLPTFPAKIMAMCFNQPTPNHGYGWTLLAIGAEFANFYRFRHIAFNAFDLLHADNPLLMSYGWLSSHL